MLIAIPAIRDIYDNWVDCVTVKAYYRVSYRLCRMLNTTQLLVATTRPNRTSIRKHPATVTVRHVDD